MKSHIGTRVLSALLLVTLTPWCVGCATEIHFRQSPATVEGTGRGRLLVRVFEDRSSRRHDVATHRVIITELYRVDGRAETLVREEREPRWAVADLAPGRYMLRANRWVDDTGAVRMLPHGDDEGFAVRANETTVAEVVLSDPHMAWAGVAIAAGVAAGVAIGTYELHRSLSHMTFNWN
jgi:hypothetical protein